MTIDARSIPTMRGYAPAPVDFDRSRLMLDTAFQRYDIDLSVALANEGYLEGIAGDFLYFDTDPTASNGVATLELNKRSGLAVAPFYVQPGFAIASPFKGITLTYALQPGKRLRVMWATGARVVPTNTATINIASTVAVNEQGFAYASSYKSNVTLAAATPENVIAAASNLNGYVVWSGFLSSPCGAGAGLVSLVAKATAPASWLDGDVVHMGTQHTGTNVSSVGSIMSRAVRVTSGKRLDRIAVALESGAVTGAECKYTIL